MAAVRVVEEKNKQIFKLSSITMCIYIIFLQTYLCIRTKCRHTIYLYLYLHIPPYPCKIVTLCNYKSIITCLRGTNWSFHSLNSAFKRSSICDNFACSCSTKALRFSF